MRNIKLIWTYFVIAFAAMLAALNYELFVFPNQFAPSGINGICTMIQYVSGISVGYLSLVVNIPLAVLVFFKVSRPLAVRSMVYVMVFLLRLIVGAPSCRSKYHTAFSPSVLLSDSSCVFLAMTG